MSSSGEITDRFRQAMDYAARKHSVQTRKASDTPYLSHLLGVCSIVMEFTTDEDVWIAALLHDAIEDQGGEPTAREIAAQFGDHVAMIVRGCSELIAEEDQPKPPWIDRKLHYLETIRNSPAEVLLVSAADKLHNARSVLADWIACGEDAYCKFTTGKRGTHWFYQQLLQNYRETGRVPEQLLRELEETVMRFAPDAVNINEI